MSTVDNTLRDDGPHPILHALEQVKRGVVGLAFQGTDWHGVRRSLLH